MEDITRPSTFALPFDTKRFENGLNRQMVCLEITLHSDVGEMRQVLKDRIKAEPAFGRKNLGARFFYLMVRGRENRQQESLM